MVRASQGGNSQLDVPRSREAGEGDQIEPHQNGAEVLPAQARLLQLAVLASGADAFAIPGLQEFGTPNGRRRCAV